MIDPDATKPDDWDEDAPRQIEDEDAEKPEGWLDDEPAEVDDPGTHHASYFSQSHCVAVPPVACCEVLTHVHSITSATLTPMLEVPLCTFM